MEIVNDGIAPGTDVTAAHVGGIDPGSTAVRGSIPCRRCGGALDVIVNARGIYCFHVHAHADDLLICWAD